MSNSQTKSPSSPQSHATSASSAPCCAPGCCDGKDARDEQTKATVRAGYSQIARTGQWSGVAEACGGGGCCGGSTVTPDQVAAAIGYAGADLQALPQGANLGLSCGNPTALAAIQPGETILDLGSGGGLDCFIAGPKVGKDGRVIGVDMTAEMVARARGNLGAYRAHSGLDNVEFRLGEIEHLPVADASVDVVISNCVLNLCPDKSRAWREIARVLKPGGRAAISDLALIRPLPTEVRRDVEALVGCIAGAVMAGLMEKAAIEAGLIHVQSQRKPEYVDAMVRHDDPLYLAVLAKLPPGSRVGDYVASFDFTAHKPV